MFCDLLVFQFYFQAAFVFYLLFKSTGTAMAVISPKIEALLCSTSSWCSSCDFASLLALQQGCLEDALIGGVTLPFSH